MLLSIRKQTYFVKTQLELFNSLIMQLPVTCIPLQSWSVSQTSAVTAGFQHPCPSNRMTLRVVACNQMAINLMRN